MIMAMAELFHALFTLDAMWFINIVLQNIVWLFILLAFAYIFFDRKHTLLNFCFVLFTVWICMDFTKMIGWVYLVPLFFFINYLGRLVIVAFAESAPSLKNKLVILQWCLFWFCMLMVNYIFA